MTQRNETSSFRLKLLLFSDHIKKHGRDEIFSFLNLFGGSPLITNGEWDETEFNVETLFEVYPKIALQFFTGYKLKRIPLFLEGGSIPSLLYDFDHGLPKQKDLLTLFDKLKLEERKQKTAMRDFAEFTKLNDVPKIEDSSKSTTVQIKDFGALVPQIKINWLKFFNSQLLTEDQVTENDKILSFYPSVPSLRLMHTTGLNKRLDAGFTFIEEFSQVSLFSF